MFVCKQILEIKTEHGSEKTSRQKMEKRTGSWTIESQVIKTLRSKLFCSRDRSFCKNCSTDRKYWNTSDLLTKVAIPKMFVPKHLGILTLFKWSNFEYLKNPSFDEYKYLVKYLITYKNVSFDQLNFNLLTMFQKRIKIEINNFRLTFFSSKSKISNHKNVFFVIFRNLKNFLPQIK